MTGQLRVFCACSLDGFIAGEGDDLSWLPEPEEGEPAEDHGYDAFMADIGALLMGRGTYDVVRGFDVDWPYGDTPVIVATRRPLDEGAPDTVVAAEGDIESLAARARDAADGKDVYVDGGVLIRQALDAGLVHDLVVTIIPVALGRGHPLFAGVEQRCAFEITRTRTLSRAVQLHLRPKR